METPESPSWKPAPQVLRWARLEITVVLVGAFTGTIGFFLRSYTITAWAVVLAVLVAESALVMLWRAIGQDPEMPPTVKRKLRLDVFLIGPVVALQLLIFNCQPTRSFSGLGGAKNASKPTTSADR